jgi:hypothetical protein
MFLLDGALNTGPSRERTSAMVTTELEPFRSRRPHPTARECRVCPSTVNRRAWPPFLIRIVLILGTLKRSVALRISTRQLQNFDFPAKDSSERVPSAPRAAGKEGLVPRLPAMDPGNGSGELFTAPLTVQLNPNGASLGRSPLPMQVRTLRRTRWLIAGRPCQPIAVGGLQ